MLVGKILKTLGGNFEYFEFGVGVEGFYAAVWKLLVSGKEVWTWGLAKLSLKNEAI